MLKVKINGKEGEIMVEANGALCELCADVTTLLSVMYDGLDKDCKEMFVKCIKDMAEKELFVKTSEEIEKEQEKIKKTTEKKLEELIKSTPVDFIKMLKDILK